MATMVLKEGYISTRELVDLSRKRAVVTGGATGIGLAISLRLAEAGAVVVVADMNIEAARKASREISDCGYQVVPMQCDVSREDQVRQMVDSAVQNLGGIDILVNNAGIYPRIPLAQITGDSFDQVMAVNLKGTFLCCREVSQRMIGQGRGGCIINIASIDAVHPSSKGMTAYDASKGGVLMFTRSLALELGRHDIRVNAVAPGGILTEGASSHFGGSAKEGRKELKAFMSRIALGRMGRADDIGRVVLFLASDLASYVTGSLVVADGGYLVS